MYGHRQLTDEAARKAIANALAEGVNPRGFSEQLRDVYRQMQAEGLSDSDIIALSDFSRFG